jgi:hypothetical protein
MSSTHRRQRLASVPLVAGPSADEAVKADDLARPNVSISVEWFGDEFGLATEPEADVDADTHAARSPLASQPPAI